MKTNKNWNTVYNYRETNTYSSVPPGMELNFIDFGSVIVKMAQVFSIHAEKVWMIYLVNEEISWKRNKLALTPPVLLQNFV